MYKDSCPVNMYSKLDVCVADQYVMHCESVVALIMCADICYALGSLIHRITMMGIKQQK